MSRCKWVSLIAQLVKNPPAVQETWVRSLGWEDPLEKETATHSNVLAWRTPWSRTRLSDFHFHFQIRHLCVCVFLLFKYFC